MTWIAIFSMAAITFFNRFVFFVDGLSYQPSDKVKRFLSYSSYAVLTSIWAPILFQLELLDSKVIGVSSAGLDYLFGASLAAVLTVAHVRSIVVVLVSVGAFFCLRLMLLS